MPWPADSSWPTGCRVEAVVVGDAELDDDLRALVAACTEAVQNAAKHAGVDEVSVYVEVEDDQVNAFVRDGGVGLRSRRGAR